MTENSEVLDSVREQVKNQDAESGSDEDQVSISAEELEGLGDLSAMAEQSLPISVDDDPDPAVSIAIDAAEVSPADADTDEDVQPAADEAIQPAADEAIQPVADEAIQPVAEEAIQPAAFEALSLGNPEENGQHTSIDMLMDVPMRVSVELGRAKMIVRDVLKLQKGSVIELNRMAGEVVDVLVNEKLIARGEVVVVDDKFGVRITELTGNRETTLEAKK